MQFHVLLRKTVLLMASAMMLVSSSLVRVSEQQVKAEERTVSEAATVYLPIASANSPYTSPFSFEASNMLSTGSTLLTRGLELGTRWIRLNHRIIWRYLQLNEGDPIKWGTLVSFEDELRQLKAAGIRPVIIVDDYPAWAVQEKDSGDIPPKVSLCAPLKEDKLDDFAEFVRALVERYKTSEFNVHDWEIGNEPDVDPSLVLATSPFGCWGDIQDPYYGGEAYGEMIKIVSQAIKAEDVRAKVWLGGLLLASPVPGDPVNFGHPELFIQGVLEAGAAPYFDYLPYHWYPSYAVFDPPKKIDHDTSVPGGPWNDWGGGTLGKAQFLRQIMQLYGVDKPLVLNETALGCPDNWPRCAPPPAEFFIAQADYAVRSFTRGMSGNISGFTWYTLDGPGWRSTGLLDAADNAQPAYIAYQQLTEQLKLAAYIGPVDYGLEVEAYAFARAGQEVHVVWAKEDIAGSITIPAVNFVEAFTRDGAGITPTYIDTNVQLPVGFSPIYVIRTP